MGVRVLGLLLPRYSVDFPLRAIFVRMGSHPWVGHTLIAFSPSSNHPIPPVFHPAFRCSHPDVGVSEIRNFDEGLFHNGCTLVHSLEILVVILVYICVVIDHLVGARGFVIFPPHDDLVIYDDLHLVNELQLLRHCYPARGYMLLLCFVLCLDHDFVLCPDCILYRGRILGRGCILDHGCILARGCILVRGGHCNPAFVDTRDRVLCRLIVA